MLLPAPWKQHVDWLPPKPGCEIQVIGAGLARTGTNSFCAAVSQLLNGPAYHVGVQTVPCGDPTYTRNWIAILRARLGDGPKSPEAKAILRRELAGYVMTTDAPVPQLVPELMELYPNAVVIVTMRDKKSWTVSMANLIKLAKIDLLEVMFAFVSNLREQPTLWRLFRDVQIDQYGYAMQPNEENLSKSWDAHMDWLREIVPKEKLLFYDVREGWEPLCKILNKPVPKDRPFPRLNDSKAMDAAFASWSLQGLTMWLIVLGILLGAVSAGVFIIRR